MVIVRLHAVLELRFGGGEGFYVGLGGSSDLVELRFGPSSEPRVVLIAAGPLLCIGIALVHGFVVLVVLILSAVMHAYLLGDRAPTVCWQ